MGSTPIWTVAFVLFAASVFGCATVDKTTRKIARDLNPALESLKIRMALLPLVDKTSLKPDTLKAAFQNPLSLAIRRKCTAVLLETGNDLLALGGTGKLPRTASGRLDAYLLSEAGRHRGFNAIASIRLESIGVRVKERGILWFKGERHMLQIHADAEIFDTLTGTKVLSRDFYFDTQINDVLREQIQSQKNLELPQIRKGLIQIAEEMGDAICEAVDDLPWRGYVTAVKENTLSLSAGKRVGLRMGGVLTVFAQGRIVEGIDGQRFILPGKPKGQIKIVSLQPNGAEAEILSGGPFYENDFVGIE
jgi:hypothetical protein